MPQKYVPGDIVPESGVYAVKHDPQHHQHHDVTCIEGRRFPPCKNCKGVYFTLRLGAKHIAEYQSF